MTLWGIVETWIALCSVSPTRLRPTVTYGETITWIIERRCAASEALTLSKKRVRGITGCGMKRTDTVLGDRRRRYRKRHFEFTHDSMSPHLVVPNDIMQRSLFLTVHSIEAIAELRRGLRRSRSVANVNARRCAEVKVLFDDASSYEKPEIDLPTDFFHFCEICGTVCFISLGGQSNPQATVVELLNARHVMGSDAF